MKGAPGRLGVVWRRILLALAAPVALCSLTACRVDMAVDVTMVQNGSGKVTVTVTADEQVVEQAPGLAGDLRLDDLTDAGWTTEGPVGTPSGGLSIELAHTFDTPEQATALIATLNGPSGPFKAVAFTRVGHTASIEYHITGQTRVNGLDGFVDPDLLAAVGATPYADAIEANGDTVDDDIGLTFNATLPGDIDTTTATSRNTPLKWTIPLDDTVVDLTTNSTASLERGRGWTVLATLSFVAFGMSMLLGIAFVAIIARRQHHRRRRRRSLAALVDLEVRDDLL